MLAAQVYVLADPKPVQRVTRYFVGQYTLCSRIRGSWKDSKGDKTSSATEVHWSLVL